MNKFILKSLLNDYEGEIYCLDETDSTNNMAGDLARNLQEGIVVAERQVRGRGRRGRNFVSEAGGLYMSLSTRVPGTPFEVIHYPVLAALAVSNAIESVCEVRADIKWPNDIQINGKKVCGILTELVTEGDECFLVTGIGINITNSLPDSLPDAGNLKDLANMEPEKEVLAAAVSNQLVTIYRKGVSERKELIEHAQRRCVTIGKKVTALSTGVSGIAKRMDEKGSLIIKLPDGTTKSIIFGDVTIQK